MFDPKELERLHSELAKMRQELDESERAVHFLTQRDYAITREDIVEMEQNGVPMLQVIAELEEIVGTPAA